GEGELHLFKSQRQLHHGAQQHAVVQASRRRRVTVDDEETNGKQKSKKGLLRKEEQRKRKDVRHGETLVECLSRECDVGVGNLLPVAREYDNVHLAQLRQKMIGLMARRNRMRNDASWCKMEGMEKKRKTRGQGEIDDDVVVA